MIIKISWYPLPRTKKALVPEIDKNGDTGKFHSTKENISSISQGFSVKFGYKK